MSPSPAGASWRRFPFDASVEIIAHRGYSARAPENTLAAIDAALNAGADAVEFDLHVTADGVPVLFHDDTLERTSNGKGRLRDRTLAELGVLDAGGWYGADFAGEPIPTLLAVLTHTRGRIVRVYPEIKGTGGARGLARMLEAVIQLGLVEQTVFISMDWTALEAMRSLNAEVGVGYIVEKESRARDGIARAAGDPRALVDFRASILMDDPALCDEARHRDVGLAAWTVDDPAQASRLLALGVPRITTNRVGDLMTWKASL